MQKLKSKWTSLTAGATLILALSLAVAVLWIPGAALAGNASAPSPVVSESIIDYSLLASPSVGRPSPTYDPIIEAAMSSIGREISASSPEIISSAIFGLRSLLAFFATLLALAVVTFTVLFVRKDSPAIPLIAPETAPTGVPTSDPNAAPTPRVAVQQTDRGPIPVSVIEVPRTTPANPAKAVQAPAIHTFSVGSNPSSLAFDGDGIWVANQNDDSISKYSLDGELISTNQLRLYPITVASDGESVWVGTYFAVFKIGPGDAFSAVPVEIRRPTAMLYAGEYIWLANSGRDTVLRIGVDSLETEVISVGKRPMALATDGEFVYVANNEGNTVSKLSMDGQ
ncbi:MAG: hypothetical protein O2821_13070, partial [Chloroflexi bacterium]|nr:hypothetical protein [Chloroflexota bacterium]